MNKVTLKCDVCKLDKPIKDFPKKSVNKSLSYKKRNNRCKACNASLAREWRKNHTNYRGSGKITSIPQEDRLLVSAISSRLTDAKMRSKKKNLPVDITRDYLYQLFKEQDRKCALTGVELRIEKKAFACLSIDKIDSNLGYVKGNVQWVAWAANRAKGDMSLEMFVDMCNKVMKYQKVQRLSKSTQ